MFDNRYSKVSTHGCGDGGKDSVCVAMLTEEQSHAAKFPGLQVFTPDHNQGERAHRGIKVSVFVNGLARASTS
jgi:predicted RNA-binding protein with TRAM domain